MGWVLAARNRAQAVLLQYHKQNHMLQQHAAAVTLLLCRDSWLTLSSHAGLGVGMGAVLLSDIELMATSVRLAACNQTRFTGFEASAFLSGMAWHRMYGPQTRTHVRQHCSLQKQTLLSKPILARRKRQQT